MSFAQRALEFYECMSSALRACQAVSRGHALRKQLADEKERAAAKRREARQKRLATNQEIIERLYRVPTPPPPRVVSPTELKHDQLMRKWREEQRQKEKERKQNAQKEWAEHFEEWRGVARTQREEQERHRAMYREHLAAKLEAERTFAQTQAMRDPADDYLAVRAEMNRLVSLRVLFALAYAQFCE